MNIFHKYKHVQLAMFKINKIAAERIFSCYRMWITRNEKYIDQNELGCRPIHVAGDIAFISIPCEVADKSRRVNGTL